MKAKNLLIATLALLIGIGSAYSTSKLNGPVYLEVKVTAADACQCMQIDLECSDVYGVTCIADVIITRSGSPAVVSAPLFTILPYTSFPVKLSGTTHTLTEFEFYDVCND